MRPYHFQSALRFSFANNIEIVGRLYISVRQLLEATAIKFVEISYRSEEQRINRNRRAFLSD